MALYTGSHLLVKNLIKHRPTTEYYPFPLLNVGAISFLFCDARREMPDHLKLHLRIISASLHWCAVPRVKSRSQDSVFTRDM